MLDPFWESIQRIIKNVFGFEIAFTCVSFYLGNFDPGLSKADRYLLRIFMAASKKAITKLWLRKNALTANQWTAIVNDIHC